MKDKKFYITTTLPYVNADPHIGFALEIVQADAIARYQSLLGSEIFFNFGTDEHGLKIYRKAIEAEKDPQEYVDEYAAKFDNLKKALNLSYNNFIRTTDPHHITAAQEFWKRCLENGDIYKKKYQVKYCVGCELEKTDSELENGRCPIHPHLEIEIIDEENYFFRFSKYQPVLLELYKNNPDFVMPDFRLNEIRNFVDNGLQDFSISRLKSKMPWGIDVPGDPQQVVYVWFDALINYISALGWPEDEEKFKNFWPGVQVAGKDNLRQQAAIWQAMLLSAGLPTSKQIFIHGFITADGQKISKSLGNVVDPYALVEKYGTDPVRYFLLAKLHPYEDGDFTYKKFEEAYNADLANGLGNLVARVAKLCENLPISNNPSVNNIVTEVNFQERQTKTPFFTALENYRFDEALKLIWEDIKVTDQYINQQEPWKLDKTARKDTIQIAVDSIRYIATKLKPFLPETANKIEKQFSGSSIKTSNPIFPRIK